MHCDSMSDLHPKLCFARHELCVRYIFSIWFLNVLPRHILECYWWVFSMLDVRLRIMSWRWLMYRMLWRLLLHQRKFFLRPMPYSMQNLLFLFIMLILHSRLHKINSHNIIISRQRYFSSNIFLNVYSLLTIMFDLHNPFRLLFFMYCRILTSLCDMFGL